MKIFGERTEKDGLKEVMAEEAARLKERRRQKRRGGGHVYTEEDWNRIRINLRPVDRKRLTAWGLLIADRCEGDYDLLYRRALALLGQIEEGRMPEAPPEGVTELSSWKRPSEMTREERRFWGIQEPRKE